MLFTTLIFFQHIFFNYGLCFLLLLGPRWWPILGCVLEVVRIYRKNKYIHKTCLELRDKYGPVVGLKMGVNHIVVLNNVQSMRAMLLNENCDGRPIGISYNARSFGARQGNYLIKKRRE